MNRFLTSENSSGARAQQKERSSHRNESEDNSVTSDNVIRGRSQHGAYLPPPIGYSPHNQSDPRDKNAGAATFMHDANYPSVQYHNGKAHANYIKTDRNFRDDNLSYNTDKSIWTT